MTETGSNLLIFLIIFIGSIILLSMQVIRPWMSRRSSWKRNALWAGIYLAILLALLPLHYLIPRQEFMQSSSDNSQTGLIAPSDITESFSSVENPDLIEGVYKNSTQTFKLDTNNITFDVSAIPVSYQIFVKRKDIDDSEVEVSGYITDRFVGKISYAKSFSPPILLLKNGRLFINPPERQNLEFKAFMADFTIDQFKHINDELMRNLYTPPGEKILYLHVPQSLEIQNSNNFNLHVL